MSTSAKLGIKALQISLTVWLFYNIALYASPEIKVATFFGVFLLAVLGSKQGQENNKNDA